MVKLVNKKFNGVIVKNKVKNSTQGWEGAIAEAKRQMVVLRLRMSGLKQLVKQFSDMQKAGEPWPGQGAGTDDKSIPA